MHIPRIDPAPSKPSLTRSAFSPASSAGFDFSFHKAKADLPPLPKHSVPATDKPTEFLPVRPGGDRLPAHEDPKPRETKKKSDESSAAATATAHAARPDTGRKAEDRQSADTKDDSAEKGHKEPAGNSDKKKTDGPTTGEKATGGKATGGKDTGGKDTGEKSSVKSASAGSAQDAGTSQPADTQATDTGATDSVTKATGKTDGTPAVLSDGRNPLSATNTATDQGVEQTAKGLTAGEGQTALPAEALTGKGVPAPGKQQVSEQTPADRTLQTESSVSGIQQGKQVAAQTVPAATVDSPWLPPAPDKGKEADLLQQQVIKGTHSALESMLTQQNGAPSSHGDGLGDLLGNRHNSGNHTASQGSPAQSAHQVFTISETPLTSPGANQPGALLRPGTPMATTEAHIANQVIEHLSTNALKGKSSIRIRLHPAELGHLKMELQVSKEQVTVHLLADNRQVQDALMNNMDRLRDTLLQQGLTLGDVHVSSRERQDNGTENNGNARRADAAVQVSENILEDDISGAVITAHNHELGRVNLRI